MLFVRKVWNRPWEIVLTKKWPSSQSPSWPNLTCSNALLTYYMLLLLFCWSTQLVRQFDNVQQQVANAQALISDAESRLLMSSSYPSTAKPSNAPQRSPPGVGACGRWVVWLWCLSCAEIVEKSWLWCRYIIDDLYSTLALSSCGCHVVYWCCASCCFAAVGSCGPDLVPVYSSVYSELHCAHRRLYSIIESVHAAGDLCCGHQLYFVISYEIC